MLTHSEILQLLHVQKNNAERDLHNAISRIFEAKQKKIKGNVPNWDLINAQKDRARLNAEIDLLRELINQIFE